MRRVPGGTSRSVRCAGLQAGYRVMPLLCAVRHRHRREARPNREQAHPGAAVLRPRPTVRWRLTLLYSFQFVICGAALLAITYWLFANFAYSPPKPGIGPGGTPLNPTSLRIATAMSVQRSIGLHRLQVYSGIALAFMAVVSGVLGWVVAGRVLAPLRTITATAERISDTNLHERIAIGGPRDELRILADTIDRLLARLEAALRHSEGSSQTPRTSCAPRWR
jgi:HAMP domain-containing protein